MFNKKYLFLILSQIFVFFIFYFSNQIMLGWLDNPTKGGFLVLSLLLILLASVSGALIFFTRFDGKLIEIEKSNEKVLITIIVLFGLMLFVFWFLLAICKTPLLRDLYPHKDVFLFIFLIILQLWLFWKRHSNSFEADWIDDDLTSRLTAIVLVIGFLIFTVIKIIFLSPLIHNLTFKFDESQYWLMAETISHGQFVITAYNHYPPLYPIAISPAFISGVENSLRSISIINSIFTSTSIFPIYLLARQFLSRKQSLAISFVSLLFPFHVVYPTLVLSENVSFPVFLWCLYFLFSRPKNFRHYVLWNILAGISIGLLWLTRYQTLAVIPVFLFGWWIKHERDPSPSEKSVLAHRLIHLFVIIGIIILVFSPWFVFGIMNELPLEIIFGTHIYEDVIPVNRTLSDLMLWSFLTLAYLVLMAAPVLVIFGIGFSRFSAIIKDQKLFRWIIFIAALAAILFITTANHGWRAGYNYPVPNRLLGRYIIYLSPLLWLTAMFLLQKFRSANLRTMAISGVTSISMVFVAYQVFFNTSWILPKNILFYIFVDGFLPSIEPTAFFVFLIILSSLVIFELNSKRNNSASVITMVVIAIMMMWTYPGFLKKINDANLFGRHMDEIFSYLNPREKYTDISSGMIWQNPDPDIALDWELRIRGYTEQDFQIAPMKGNPAKEFGCKTRLMLQRKDGSSVAIVENLESCVIPPEILVKSYLTNGTTYSLIDY